MIICDFCKRNERGVTNSRLCLTVLHSSTAESNPDKYPTYQESFDVCPQCFAALTRRLQQVLKDEKNAPQYKE